MSKRDESTLSAIRQRIDDIDAQLLELLARRAQAALEVAGHPGMARPGSRVDHYHPEREAQLLRAVLERNSGPLDDGVVQRIFREIISASLALEAPMAVAYLGPEGSYTHAATLKHFGRAIQPVPEPGIAEIFHSVEAGRVRFGVVPVENSTEGAINHTLDQLMKTALRICGEIRLRIQHRLLTHAPELAAVTAVHAHPQSLAQCRGWLNVHLPLAERVAQSSNAVAARLAVSQPEVAAIAGESAAEQYALPTLMAGIEDEKTNTTRFLVLGDMDVPPSGEDATSILLTVPHKPGGLRRMLEPFESAGLSLTRIESRPSRSQLWDYVFFIDLLGHREDATVKPVLETLQHELPLMRVLGSYPCAL